MSFFDLFVVQPIFNMLMALYALVPGGDFGIAVILFTIFVRLALWPLVRQQLHQVKAMRKLQPELVKLKKQAKGNKQMEGMMMMELYKKHNVNPFRTIFILVLQLPIFIGLYHVIQIFTSHRDELSKFTYSFLESWQPIKDLIAHPETFNQQLFGVIDLTRHAIDASGVSPFLVVLAVASGFLQYVSSKQTMPQKEVKKGLRQIMAEAAEGKEADQSEMNAVVTQKMVKVLPIFMIFIMLSLPGAIALYYAVSTAVAVLQQHILLKQDEEEMEEIAEEGEEANHKKATLKARAKQAKPAKVVSQDKKKDDDSSVIRVVAKSTSKKKGGK